MNNRPGFTWLFAGVFTIALLTGLLMGYVTAVIAGALQFVSEQFSLSLGQQGLLVSVILFGAFIGSLTCQHVINPLGQKKTLILIALMFVVGSLMCAYSHAFYNLLIGRFFTGLAVGMVNVSGPMYVAETSPVKYRGFFVGSVQLAITMGIFLAYVINYYFSSSHNWSMMFGLATLPALLLMIVAWFQVESPVWLFLKGRKQEAHLIYQRLHGVTWQLDDEIVSPSSTPVNLREFFQPLVLPITLFACGLFFFQNLSGIDAILYYAPEIFQLAGFKGAGRGLQVAMFLGLINIIATLFSMWLLDKIGRRPVLIYGLSAMFLSLLLFSILSLYPAPAETTLIKWLSAIMLMIFVAAFALSMGPIPYVLMSELFPSRLRMIGMGLASATSWGINALITFAYPLLVNVFSLGIVFLIFTVVCFTALVISVLFCPETNQLSLESIEKKLKSGVALRNLSD